MRRNGFRTHCFGWCYDAFYLPLTLSPQLRSILGRSLLAAACICAFLYRVLPALEKVFPAASPGVVSFQEADGWFHIRTVENQLAHFPWRSTHDPYMLYPGGGQEVPTGPFWDYLLATIAWTTHIPANLIGAWLPPLIGALFPLLAYRLGTRVFGPVAGHFAAWWVALMPGGFLWLTHLGLSDHHAVESLLALLTLLLLVEAVSADTTPSRANRLALLAGVTLGCYLATRPAGIMVPGLLAVACMFAPSLAPLLLRTIPVAALVFAPATGVVWSEYTWLALMGCGAVALAVTYAEIREWPARRRWATLACALAVAAIVFAVVKPGILPSLLGEIRRLAGFGGGASRVVAAVQELQPLHRAYGGTPLNAFYQQLGAAWILVLPAGVAAWIACIRRPDAPRILFGVWSTALILGSFWQVRNLVYGAPLIGILAGAASAWLVGAPPYRLHLRAIASGALVALLLIAGAWGGIGQLHDDAGPSTDWYEALNWMRQNTPDPFDGAPVWEGLHRGHKPVNAASYGICVWWDYGYWVESIARRVPFTNGTQVNVTEVSKFYIETSPDEALAMLRRNGLRYVITDPSLPVFTGATARVANMLGILGEPESRYYVALTDRSTGRKQVVFLPDYYRMMAVRLYLFDGEAVDRKLRIQLFELHPGDESSYDWTFEFQSEEAAREYMAANSSRKFLVGSLDPSASCVPLDPVPWAKLAYSSDPLPISRERLVRAVKIFEVAGF